MYCYNKVKQDILDYLGEECKSMSDIVANTPYSYHSVRKALDMLWMDGLVTRTRVGTRSTNFRACEAIKDPRVLTVEIDYPRFPEPQIDKSRWLEWIGRYNPDPRIGDIIVQRYRNLRVVGYKAVNANGLKTMWIRLERNELQKRGLLKGLLSNDNTKRPR